MLDYRGCIRDPININRHLNHTDGFKLRCGGFLGRRQMLSAQDKLNDEESLTIKCHVIILFNGRRFFALPKSRIRVNLHRIVKMPRDKSRGLNSTSPSQGF